jgi:hypothetical protein
MGDDDQRPLDRCLHVRHCASCRAAPAAPPFCVTTAPRACRARVVAWSG